MENNLLEHLNQLAYTFNTYSLLNSTMAKELTVEVEEVFDTYSVIVNGKLVYNNTFSKVEAYLEGMIQVIKFQVHPNRLLSYKEIANYLEDYISRWDANENAVDVVTEAYYNKVLNNLINEYRSFIKANALPSYSADELLAVIKGVL